MYLGIDLGKKTTGLAISSGELASSYKTITHNSTKDAIDKVSKICQEESIDKIIIGYVEGKIKNYFEKFAQQLKQRNPQLEVVLWDETLTSRQATESMIKLDIPKNKRRQKVHEIAATLILQSYLDENK